jgi:hypothetical protein
VLIFFCAVARALPNPAFLSFLSVWLPLPVSISACLPVSFPFTLVIYTKSDNENDDSSPRPRLLESAESKLTKHFGVSKSALTFLRDNEKVLRFFGEAPPPDSYQQGM